MKLGCLLCNFIWLRYALFYHATATTVQCRYNAVNFVPNLYQIHPIAQPLGWFDTDLYSASVNEVLYEILCYNGTCYSSTWLYDEMFYKNIKCPLNTFLMNHIYARIYLYNDPDLGHDQTDDDSIQAIFCTILVHYVVILGILCRSSLYCDSSAHFVALGPASRGSPDANLSRGDSWQL